MPSSESPTPEAENTVAATAFRHELPYVNRPAPRAYGVGRYGVAKYDERDNTRYAWTRVVPAISAFLIAMLLGAAPARAQNAYCESTDATTTSFLLCKPAVDVEGANRWGDKINTNLDMIESAFGTITAATATASSQLSALAISTTALSASTVAIAGRVSTLEVWQGTVSPHIALLNTSTQTLRADFSAFISTAGPLGDALNVSTQSLFTTKASTGASSITSLPGFTPGGMADGSIYGQDIALSTISISAFNKSGCAATQSIRRNAGDTAWECYSPATGTGDVVLASTQTFSGANTFLSTTNFTGAVPGVYVEIASAAVTAATAYTFTATSYGISFSTEDFRLEYNMFQNTTAGGYTLTFNGSGSGYLGILHETFSNGSEATEAATAYCSVTDTATEIAKVGTGSKGRMDFSTVPTRPDLRVVVGESHWTENSVSLATKSETGCTHTGSGQLTSVTFTATAGTMTGYLSLQVKRRR